MQNFGPVTQRRVEQRNHGPTVHVSGSDKTLERLPELFALAEFWGREEHVCDPISRRSCPLLSDMLSSTFRYFVLLIPRINHGGSPR